MKAIINTKSNYNRLNGEILEVIRTGNKTVTCIVPKKLDPNYGTRSCFDKEVDFSKSEVILTHEIPQTDKGRVMAKEDGCVCCGKKTDGTLYIHTVAELWEAVNTDDEKELKEAGVTSQGCFSIGPDCAKKFPEGFVFKSKLK